MTEQWKPIDGYPGYEISDLGNVRCWNKRNRNSETPTTPRPVKTFPNRGGYPKVVLGFKNPTLMVHRLVAEAFVPGQAEGLEVAHNNGDRMDNKASNLRWTTRKGNLADKRLHGTSGKKLAIEQARKIRQLFAEGQTRKQIAPQFGVTHGTVAKIVRNDLWKEAA